jgi:hypothetical protein
VTNNSTRVRIGYQIYSLWRFIAVADYNYNENTLTLALVASHFDDSLQALISSASRD